MERDTIAHTNLPYFIAQLSLQHASADLAGLMRIGYAYNRREPTLSKRPHTSYADPCKTPRHAELDVEKQLLDKGHSSVACVLKL